MPTPATGSTKASTILARIKGKLVEALVSDDPSDPTKRDRSTYVRIIARPDPKYANYKPEEGVAIFFRSPGPETYQGAGRYGLKTHRILEVHVATMNLLDVAGNAETAMAAHLDLEESVVNILLPSRPEESHTELGGSTERIGVNLVWLPGSEDIERQVRTDVGMIFSALVFEVSYIPPLDIGLVETP